jgi:hypothetical protein
MIYIHSLPHKNTENASKFPQKSAKLLLQSSELGLRPNTSPAGECPPPTVLVGGAHSLAREGLGESQFRRGGIPCGTLYIYMY